MRRRTDQIVMPRTNEADAFGLSFFLFSKTVFNKRRSTTHSLCIINTLIQSSLFESEVAEGKVNAYAAGHVFIQYIN